MAPHRIQPLFRFLDQNLDSTTHENPASYEPGGLHPVILGDVLSNPSNKNHLGYRIVLKLGFGAFSVVWLAEELKSTPQSKPRLVAIKICKASKKGTDSNEVAILKELQTPAPGKRRNKAVLQLIDSFRVDGPNGSHECLVTELVASIETLDRSARTSPKVLRQFIDGFALLHQQDIVHGDPHLDNFGLAVPLIKDISVDDIDDNIGVPDLVPMILHKFSSADRKSYPAYLVTSYPGSFDHFLQGCDKLPQGEKVDIRILDWGRARKINKMQPMPGSTLPMFRPPEVYLFEETRGKHGDMWSKEADIWSVGCILCFLMLNAHIASPRGKPGENFSRCLELGGRPPDGWVKAWNTRYPNCTKVADLSPPGAAKAAKPTKGAKDPWATAAETAWKKLRAEALKNNPDLKAKERKVDQLIEVLKHMIVADPKKRWSMDTILQDSFFV